MAYPDQLLADDERVVKHLHPHWIELFVPAVVLVITVGLGSFLAAIVPDGGAQTPLRLAILVVAVIIVIWWVIIPVLRQRTSHYVITSHRVLIRTGILNHVGQDISHQRITDVMFEQSLWDRIIGAGSLRIQSAGEHGQQLLEHVPHSDKVQHLLNRLVEEDSDRRSRDAATGIADALDDRYDDRDEPSR